MMRKTALLLAIGLALASGANASDFMNRSAGYQLKKPIAAYYDERPVVATAPSPAAPSFPVVHFDPQPLLPGVVTQQIQVNTYFDFDRSQLQAAGEQRLDGLISDIVRLRPDYGMGSHGFVVGGELIGHTDSIGSATYNQSLSERRALAAERHLRDRGVDTSRLTIFGMGETMPIADNATEAGRAVNRRTEINMQLITTPDF